MLAVRNSVLLVVLAFLLVLALSAQAQTPSVTDPFTAMNQELSRTVAFHLEQAAEASERLAIPANMRDVPARRKVNVAGADRISLVNIFRRVSPERVSVARQRLQALGV